MGDFEADVDVPRGHVIVERTLEILGEPIRMMLRQIRINKGDEEACVEELGEEYVFCDG